MVAMTSGDVTSAKHREILRGLFSDFCVFITKNQQVGEISKGSGSFEKIMSPAGVFARIQFCVCFVTFGVFSFGLHFQAAA